MRLDRRQTVGKSLQTRDPLDGINRGAVEVAEGTGIEMREEERKPERGRAKLKEEEGEEQEEEGEKRRNGFGVPRERIKSPRNRRNSRID